MKKNHLTILALLLSPVCFPNPAYAGGGGNGVRGGGTGIYCEDQTLILVDEAVAKDDRIEPELLTRLEILDRLQTRLARHPDLIRTIMNRLLSHGPAEYWPQRQGFLPRLDVTFDSLYSGYIPKGCRLVNISGFERDNPGSKPAIEQTAFLELSPARYPLLELHEAIFSVGIDTYGHHNAVLAQKLVGAIIARDIHDTEVEARVEFFLAPNRSKSQEIGGIFPLISGEREFCPSSVIFERTGGYGTQMSFVENGKYVSTRLPPRSYLAHITGSLGTGKSQVLVFRGKSCVYRKIPWLPSSDAQSRALMFTLGTGYSR